VGGAMLSVIHCCHPWSFVVCCFLSCLLYSLSYGPGAPAIHLTSSCLSAWEWVLCQLSLLSLSLSFIIIVPIIVCCCLCCCHLSSLSLSFIIVHCPCHHCLSLFVVIIPILVICPRLSSSLSSSFVCLSVPVILHPSVGYSSSSVIYPLIPPTVHPTSSCL
jgi:hypothetical protein